MAPRCGVCHDSDSKYKCPTCELRYCSIKCYKSHKITHDTIAATTTITTAEPKPPVFPATSSPGLLPQPNPTQTHNAKPSFSTLLSDPAFQTLFTRYPQLRHQLQLIYAVTLEPSPDESRSWNSAIRWDGSSRPAAGNPSRPHRSFRGGRGRGGVGRGGFARGGQGRGGARFGTSSSSSTTAGVEEGRIPYAPLLGLEDPGLRGPWTREKGDKMGLSVLRRMRSGEGEEEEGPRGSDGELAEGMREFVQLCQMRFGREFPE